MDSSILLVPELSCQVCAAAIKETVGALDGVADVHVDLGRRDVTVWFEAGRVTLDLVVAAIQSEGYDVATS